MYSTNPKPKAWGFFVIKMLDLNNYNFRKPCSVAI